SNTPYLLNKDRAMSNQDHNQLHDNDDIEIVTLPDSNDEVAAQKQSGRVSSPSSLTSRYIPRQRALQIVTITSIIILLILLIILSGSLPVRTLAIRLLLGPTPSPTASIALGSDLFYIRSNIPWAHFSLDGRPLAHPPVI